MKKGVLGVAMAAAAATIGLVAAPANATQPTVTKVASTYLSAQSAATGH